MEGAGRAGWPCELSGLRAQLGDHFDGAGVFGAGFHDERGGADEALEVGALLKGDGAGAEDLAADVAVDEGAGGGDRIEELDAGAFLNAQVPAVHGTDDFAMAADDEVAGAFHGSGEFAEDGEVMAAEGDAGDDAGFLDHDVAAGLDAAVPMLVDLVVEQADVAAAFRALAGLCVPDGGVGIAATEAGDFPRWLGGVEKPHQEGLRCLHDRAATEERRGLGRFGKRLGLRIGILTRDGEAGDWVLADDSLAVADLEIGAARPALRGNHECGLGLHFSAFRASYLDAMALGLIGHGSADGGSKGLPSTS